MFERWNQWLQNHPRLAGGILFLTTYVVYCGTLSNLFVHDDIPQILENPYLKYPRFWKNIFTGSVWSFRGPSQHDNMYRPLQFAVYWLLYRINGPNPIIFHLFLLLFYGATVWLVFRLASKLLPSALLAFAGALLWALHPLHVEAAAWISALPDVGAAFFYLLAFLIFVTAEQSEDRSFGRYALAAAAYFPALFFKEMALTFPIFILVYWFFFPGRNGWMRKVLCWSPMAAAVAIYVPIRIKVLGSFTESQNLMANPKHLAEVAMGLLGQHAKLFVWPVHLSIFRSFELQESLHSPWPEIALLAMLGALLLRKREPLLGFLIVWWGVTLLPCLDVRQVNLPVADRFSFLPTVGPCLALAYLALEWLPQRLKRPQFIRVLAPALGVLMVLCVVQDALCVARWHDNVSLWDQAYKASPHSALAHLLHGVVLMQRDANMNGAAKEFRLTIKLNDASEHPLVGVAADAWVMLGEIASFQNRMQEALDDYHAALRIAPGDGPAYKALGILYFPRGQYEEARGYFEKAVLLDPNELESRFFLGTCYLKLGQPLEAAAQFHAARVADSTYIQAWQAEARALDAAGDPAAAEKVRDAIPKL